MTSRHRLPEARARRTGTLAVAAVLVVLGATEARAQVAPGRDTDSIDITGRQNLTLGSGARAYGMGGAFLARADDATAASWNPAGLSYLRQPELTLVGVHNSFDTQRPSADDLLQQENDNFTGGAIDFAAFTWPITIGEVGGAIQVSYQRAISFDGQRRIDVYGTPAAPEDGGDEGDEAEPVVPAAVNPTQPVLRQHTDGSSDGGFDVVAFGTGLRLSRRVRLGLTVNRWTNGYDQLLRRQYVADPTPRPVREFGLDFRPNGWSFNLGVIYSPVERLNLAAVYKTAPGTDVRLDKSRRDTWGAPGEVEEVTSNAYSNPDARLDLPSSYGFGVSWRPRDTLTLSADFTRARWSEALIDGYFDLPRTARSDEDGNPAPKPAPFIRPSLQYPTLRDPSTERALQTDAQQLRLGLEYVFLTRQLKVPLRVGYFSDRQITPNPTGDIPRFNGLTAGIGVVLGSMLLDVAYVYEFGEYSVSTESVGESPTNAQIRYALTTNRVYASVIYRFRGRP
jgi:long-subunit fatty acid transport protein